MSAEHENVQLFNQFICVSFVTKFSKEQNKLSTSAVYQKHCCYRTFLADLQSDYFQRCLNYDHSWGHVYF